MFCKFYVSTSVEREVKGINLAVVIPLVVELLQTGQTAAGNWQQVCYECLPQPTVSRSSPSALSLRDSLNDSSIQWEAAHFL